ncbi:MAG: DUF4388 domain-containing protein [Pseudomonadota bacterium]
MKGDLTKTPFPQVLWEVYKSQLTGALEIRKDEIEKTLILDAGFPVHVESNLLHETLGRILVTQKVITPEQKQMALLRSIETKKMFGTSLIEIGAIQPAQLYEAVQTSIELKILDLFTWERGAYKFVEDAAAPDRVPGLKMNPVRLLLKGIVSSMPLEWIEKLGITDQSVFRLASRGPVEANQIEPTTEDVRILQHLKNSRSAGELQTQLSISRERILRKLYAYRLMGLVSEEKAGTKASPEGPPVEVPLQKITEAEPKKSIGEVDPETREFANQIASEHMNLMTLNYFELLNVPEDAAAVEIRDRFVEFAIRFNPGRFKTAALGEFRAHSEEIFLRGVKAFSTLSDFESKRRYLEQVRAERSKVAEGRPKRRPGEGFKIQTKLVDARAQFEQGVRVLREGRFQAAMEFFQYCADIEPSNPSYLAHWGWALFKFDPQGNLESAEQMLKRALNMGANAYAAYFLGKFYVETGRIERAIPLLRSAVDQDPGNAEMSHGLLDADSRR